MSRFNQILINWYLWWFLIDFRIILISNIKLEYTTVHSSSYEFPYSRSGHLNSSTKVRSQPGTKFSSWSTPKTILLIYCGVAWMLMYFFPFLGTMSNEVWSLFCPQLMGVARKYNDILPNIYPHPYCVCVLISTSTWCWWPETTGCCPCCCWWCHWRSFSTMERFPHVPWCEQPLLSFNPSNIRCWSPVWRQILIMYCPYERGRTGDDRRWQCQWEVPRWWWVYPELNDRDIHNIVFDLYWFAYQKSCNSIGS